LVIADDHPLLVDGLKNVLEEIQDVKAVATAGNGFELINILRKTPVDLCCSI
jgi:DNA-binding NarL/FixJ family response regulator